MGSKHRCAGRSRTTCCGARRPGLTSDALRPRQRSSTRSSRSSQRRGEAHPSGVDDYLRRATAASLADEHATARAIFEALLEPIGNGEIQLGQDEMTDEVLSVDLYDCVARYLLGVYLDTSAEERAEAILAATERVAGVGAPIDPLGGMERARGRALPKIDAFLDGCLKASTKRGAEWPSDHDRWRFRTRYAGRSPAGGVR